MVAVNFPVWLLRSTILAVVLCGLLLVCPVAAQAGTVSKDKSLGISYLQRGVQAYSADRYVQALQFLTQATAAMPSEPLVFVARAQVLIRLNRIREALPDLKKALPLAKYKGMVHSRLGLCYLQLGQFDEAEKELEEAIRCNEVDPLRWSPWMNYLNLAEVERRLGKNRDASEFRALGNALRAEISARDKREQLDFPGALKAADVLVQAKPDIAYSHYVRGIIRLNAGLGAKAAEDFTCVVERQKDFPLAYYFRADALNDCRRPVEALKDYSKIVALSPNVVALVDVAETGRCKTAGKSYDEGAVTMADIYCLRAATYRRLKQFDPAMADVQKSLQLNPEDLDVKLIASDILIGEGKTRQGLEQLEQIHKESPENAYCLQLLTDAYAKSKRLKDALDTANALVKTTREETTAFMARANVYAQMRNWNSCVSDYTRALENGDLNNQLFREDAFKRRAEAYAEMGDWQHVLEDCNSGLKILDIGKSGIGKADLQKLKEKALQQLKAKKQDK